MFNFNAQKVLCYRNKKQSFLFHIMLNYLEITSKKIEDISEIQFISERNENLKKQIISLLLEGLEKQDIQPRLIVENNKLIEEIKDNTSIKIILKEKNDEDILELLNELLTEFKELINLKKIESLEKELINNLDENSYSELLKLKSQLNGE